MGRLKGKKFDILFALLLLLQILFMVYWGNAKSGYYWDEYFTFDNAHYISSSTPDRVKLYDADFMEYDKWLNVSDIKETLTVNKSSSLFNDSLIYNIKAFMDKPYMALLNYVESVFFPDQVNKWGAVGMNIVFFAVGQIFLYMLLKRIADSKKAALIAIALFGFSGIAVSMVAFVRFYMLVNMWMIIFLYLHSLMWTEDNLKKNIVYEVFAMIVLYLAFKNSPLAVIEGAAMIVLFAVALFARKRKKQFLCYALPIVGGGILYVAFCTDYMQILFRAGDVAGGSMGVATASLVGNMLELTPSNFISRSIMIVNYINDYLFGHIFVLTVVLACMVLAVIRKIYNREQIDEKRSFVYFTVIGTFIIYFIAAVCFEFGEIRYNSFMYPLIAIVAATVATDVGEGVVPRVKIGVENMMCIVLALAVCVEIFFTATIPRIQNLYMEDRTEVAAIRENSGIDNIILDYNMDDKVQYECLAYADDATRVMFMHIDDCDFSDAPDTVLVWQSVNWKDEFMDKLKAAGYSDIEQIAQTHESKVFLCSK